MVLTVLAAVSLVLSTLALVVGGLALIEIKALKTSTHSIEYINPESLVNQHRSAKSSIKSDKDLEHEAKKMGLVDLTPDDIDEDFDEPRNPHGGLDPLNEDI